MDPIHLGVRCRCVWDGDHCSKPATQEDGLCDWCGTRRVEQLVVHPNAMLSPDGEYLGLGGRDQHGQTAEEIDRHVANGASSACWMPGSGRVLLPAAAVDKGGA